MCQRAAFVQGRALFCSAAGAVGCNKAVHASSSAVAACAAAAAAVGVAALSRTAAPDEAVFTLHARSGSARQYHVKCEGSQPSTAARLQRCSWCHGACQPPGGGHLGEPAALPAWLKSHGGYVFKGLEVLECRGKGLGLVAREAVAEGSALVQVPAPLVIAAEEQRKLAPSTDFVEELPQASRQLRERLAEEYMAADAANNGDVSKKSSLLPWLLCLWPPPGLPLLLCGTVGEHALRGTILHSHALALRASLQAEVEGGGVHRDAREAREQAVAWAQAVLMSRAYQLPRVGSNVPRLVLAPLIDVANSASTHKLANARLRAEADGSVSLVAVRQVSAGEEILTCYGEFDNEQMIFTYGYLPSEEFQRGPVCPLAMPVKAPQIALWRRITKKLRSGDNQKPVSGGPARLHVVSHATAEANAEIQHVGQGSSAEELLALLRVSNLSDEEAESMLSRCRANTVPELGVGVSERVTAAQLLAAWEAELHAAINSRERIHATGVAADLEALRPTWWLQDQTLAAVQKARSEVVQMLPAPFRLNWLFRDGFAALRREAAKFMG